MKKFIISLLAAFLLTCTQVFAENIKFIQVTDLHLTDSEYSTKLFESAIEDINSLSDVSFVVFTGDNIDYPKEIYLKHFIEIVGKLNVPYYIVIGNHDVYKSQNMSKARYLELFRKKNLFFTQRKPNYKFKKKDFMFYIVDGAKEVIPGPVGYFRKDTLAWLDKQLTKNSKNPSVIFQHYPLVYPEGAEKRLKTHKTYKAEEYLEMLDKHNNVLAIVSGHLHTNGEIMRDGVYHISTPSMANLPHSYKIIDIVTTKEFSPIIYTQLREFEIKD
ncbi:metallophosphoesterase [bacterium]|nr:metallophosphoesterase [bacterium]